MRLPAVLCLVLIPVLLAQKPFREYPGREYTNFNLPPDYQKKAEWTRARLMYRDYSGPLLRGRGGRGGGFGGFGGGGFRRGGGGGGGGGSWTTDYPRSDRHLLEGVRRLTRIDAASVEQPTALDGSDDIYNWPMLYAVEVGHWEFDDEEAKQLRDFINRGGFLMVDDFHGDTEWEVFLQGITKVFPDREVVELDNKDPIFHTLYDLDDRFQVPGTGALRSGVTYEQGNNGGRIPHWRGIYDGKHRLVVAICHNMDLGDAWEHSDEAEYPLKAATLAYEIGMNYFVYDLTH